MIVLLRLDRIKNFQTLGIIEILVLRFVDDCVISHFGSTEPWPLCWKGHVFTLGEYAD